MRSTASDLRQFLTVLGQPQDAKLTFHNGAPLAGFLQVCEDIEPDLVFGDSASRAVWLHALGNLRFVVRQWENGASGQYAVKGLYDLIDVAEKSWRGPSGRVAREMPFIKNPELKTIAERDYGSLVAMLKQGEWKTALVLAGCVIEAALADALDRQPTQQRAQAALQAAQKAHAEGKGWGKKFDENDPAKWTFYQMIMICGPDGIKLVGSRTVAAANAVRDLRNFVHPREEAAETKTYPLRGSDGSTAFALVQLVLDDLGI